MRVIAGEVKGHPLKAPRKAGVRPTSDLVRGAIFNIVGPYFSEEERVLDVYAGTGALGIEALSRGAGWADFIDNEPQCCAVIQENLQRLGLADRAKVYCLSAQRALPQLVGPYSLVFMDPPYGQAVDVELVSALVDKDLLEREGQLVLERSVRSQEGTTHDYPSLALEKQRRHGDTMILLFTREERSNG